MNFIQRALKKILVVLFFSITFLSAQPLKDFKWQQGEELVYSVDWSFVYLGTVTMSNLGQKFVNGKEAYHIQVVIESTLKPR